MQQRQYHKEMQSILQEVRTADEAPKLLLHSCCAPCSSAVLEQLSEAFEIVDFFYNPNIAPEKEYHARSRELERLVSRMPFAHKVTFVEGRYDPERFFSASQGHEEDPEGGERCKICFRMRLEEAAKQAKQHSCDFFTTTLTISPLKNAEVINTIGEEIAQDAGVRFLPSDFKKQDGYKRSTELSAEYDLYRQNYCGCVFSRMAGDKDPGKEG